MRLPVGPVLVLLLTPLFCLGSCSVGGYRFQSAYDDQRVRTVAVEIFENRTQSPGLAEPLAEAIAAEIQRSTPWRITTSSRADTTLTGVIQFARHTMLSRSRGVGLAQEVAYELTVDFDWLDNSSGQVLAQRRSLDAMATFIPQRGVSERMEVGRHGAIQRLAEAIVAEMRSDW